MHVDEGLGPNPFLASREAEQEDYLPLDLAIPKTFAEDSFLFLSLWGKMGSGKSTLALTLLWWTYRDMNHPEDCEHCWQLALNFMVFTLKDLVHLIMKALSEERRLPLVIWDDAGVHGGKRTKLRDEVFMEFSESFDAIRIVINTLILTLPLPNDTVAAMRSKYSGEILVGPRGWFNYYWHSYHVSFYSPGEPFFSKIWVEKGQFSEIPKHFYEKYYLKKRVGLFEQKFVTVSDKTFKLEDEKGTVILSDIDLYILQRLKESNGEKMQDYILRPSATHKGLDKFKVRESLFRLENHAYIKKEDGEIWALLPEGNKALKRPAD